MAGWTATVRPAESITEPEKQSSLEAYGDSGPLGNYEYDHFVPLELGGATNDPRNLWPEPGASPNPKDAVELELRDEVCSGELSLARAQHEIVADWGRLGRVRGGGHPSSGGGCRARAVYNSRYGDYDVYVTSRQPDAGVTVSGGGHVRSWHTHSNGRADVYFPGSPASRGERITVTIGSVHCNTTL